MPVPMRFSYRLTQVMASQTAIFLLLLFGLCNSAAQDSHLARLAGRDVAMQLVKVDDLTSVPWPDTEVVLREAPTLIKADQNIYMLLQANGVAPDSEAFALVYDLNPAIKDVGSLSPNSRLQLPAVTGGPQLQSLLKNGVVAQLVVDPELRQEFEASIAGLKSLAPSIGALTSQPECQQQVQNLIQWFTEIETRFRRRTDVPLSHATLLQMRDEAGLLQSLLAQAKASHQPITSVGTTQVAAIYDDIKLEMRQYGQTLAGVAPRAESSYVVKVNIKGTNESYISGLRVYYTFNGLFPPPPEPPPARSMGFRNLGSGQSENLLQKNYRVWAAKDGDASHPVTPPYLLRIDLTASGPVTVDLSLSGGSHP
jgi:hypothetical protein